jgi:hypothetical protein
VISKYLWRGALVVLLCLTLAIPTNAGGLPSGGGIVAAEVAVVAVVVIVAVVLVRGSSKKTITGCVSSQGNTLSLTNEKDQRTYTLSGNTSGIKSGDRMTLQGRKGEPNGADKTLVWEIKKVTADFGACHP